MLSFGAAAVGIASCAFALPASLLPAFLLLPRPFSFLVGLFLFRLLLPFLLLFLPFAAFSSSAFVSGIRSRMGNVSSLLVLSALRSLRSVDRLQDFLQFPDLLRLFQILLTFVLKESEIDEEYSNCSLICMIINGIFGTR